MPTSPLHKLGPEQKMYKVVMPDGRYSLGDSVWDALELATSKKETKHIRDEHLKWSEYQTITPSLKGRFAPVAKADQCYEQCLVTYKSGDTAFEVYRATNYAILKGVGIQQTKDNGRKKKTKSANKSKH